MLSMHKQHISYLKATSPKKVEEKELDLDYQNEHC